MIIGVIRKNGMLVTCTEGQEYLLVGKKIASYIYDIGNGQKYPLYE